MGIHSPPRSLSSASDIEGLFVVRDAHPELLVILLPQLLSVGIYKEESRGLAHLLKHFCLSPIFFTCPKRLGKVSRQYNEGGKVPDAAWFLFVFPSFGWGHTY